MNILYILGNGFDKAQGLATSYKEFYHDWQKRKPESELEQKIISSIKNDYDSWADLEKGLGEYSAMWDDEKSFRGVLKIFNARLKEYLLSQNNRLGELSLSQEVLLRDLCQPELFLEEVGRSIYNDIVYGDSKLVQLYIVTFNYTNTFENALGEVRIGDVLDRVYQNSYFYQGILHIHGTLDDMILLGVNDESQIENESFRSNAFLRNDFIKPEINDGCMNTRNADFAHKIKTANIIVLFGVSVGETDNRWWQAIGERMNSSNPPLLIYFPYDPSKDTTGTPSYKRIWSDQFISFLQERMRIKHPIETLQNRIRIGINKDFLKLSGLIKA